MTFFRDGVNVTRYTPDPARAALRELVEAVSEHTLRPCQTSDARLVLAMNAARNALKAGT